MMPAWCARPRAVAKSAAQEQARGQGMAIRKAPAAKFYVHILHHQVGDAGFFDADVEQVDDGGVGELPDDLRFAQELLFAVERPQKSEQASDGYSAAMICRGLYRRDWWRRNPEGRGSRSIFLHG